MIENMHYTLMYCAEHHHGCMVQGWHEAIPDGFSLLNSPYPNDTHRWAMMGVIYYTNYLDHLYLYLYLKVVFLMTLVMNYVYVGSLLDYYQMENVYNYEVDFYYYYVIQFDLIHLVIMMNVLMG